MRSVKLMTLLFILFSVQPALGAELAAYYPFDGDVKDHSGNGNHAVPYGGVTFASACQDLPETAVEFNGLDEYLLVPSSPSLCPQELTLATMVYIDSLGDGANTDTFINKLYGSPHEISYELGALVSNSHFIFGLNLGSTGHPTGTVESTTEVELGRWYHVAGTYDGSALRIYVDGVLENTVPYSYPISYDGRDLELGVHAGYIHHLDGRLDETRIYDTALEEAEIAALIPMCVPHLVAYYCFNGDATDCSGNGNDGSGEVGFGPDCQGTPETAAAFDGYNTHVLVPNSPLLCPEQLTLATMVYIDSLGDGSNTDTFINKLYGNPHEISYELGALVSNSHFIFGLNFGSTGYPTGTVESTTEVELGRWYHVAGTYDGSALRIYVDGVLEDTVPYSYPISYDDRDLEIGAHAGYIHHLDGRLDETRIYDAALEEAEIVDLIPTCLPEMAAQYCFDGDMRDCSGRGPDGVAYGDFWFDTDCHYQDESMAVFNGENTYVLVPDHPLVCPEQLSVTTFVRIDSLADASGTDTFINKLYGGPHEISYELGVLVGSGRFIFGVNLGSTGHPSGTVESTTIVDLGSTYHVAGTFDGSALRIYVNGVLENTVAYSYPISYDGRDLEIGAHSGYIHYLEGRLDDLRIYGQALEPTQVALLVDPCLSSNVPNSPAGGAGNDRWVDPRPNPFASNTTLELNLPEAGPLDLQVFDAGGRRVRRLMTGTLRAGQHRIVWDGRSDAGTVVAPGVYFLRAKEGSREQSTRLVILK